MSPDHWSKLTWDTVSAGGYDLFDPIGYLDRKRDRAYNQRVIVTPAINFVFSIGKQPYRDVINFVSYIHVVYSYNDINFTDLYIRTNYLRHLANIVDILWSRPFGGGGGGAGQLPIELVKFL